MRKIKEALFLLAMPFLFQGCVGYDRTLFVTKTNVGIDFDTTPPTAEINIARKEVVIEPTFSNGETPPVLGSFSMASKGMFADVSSTFSGGDAAVTMATLYSDETVMYDDPNFAQIRTNFDSTVKLNEKPLSAKQNIKGSKAKPVMLHGKSNTKPFYFATDTSLGLKVTWNGATAAMPDSFKLGFNRKEFALAPVYGESNRVDGMFDVKMPSFLATIDSSSAAGSIADTGVAVVQYFATGKAADRMALRQPVRLALAKRLDPVAAAEDDAIRRLAMKKNEALLNNADAVVKAVTKSGGNTVDGGELTKLLPGTGLDASWVSKYADKPVEELRKDLAGVNLLL